MLNTYPGCDEHAQENLLRSERINNAGICYGLSHARPAQRKTNISPPGANKHVQTHDSIILHDMCLENNSPGVRQ